MLTIGVGELVFCLKVHRQEAVADHREELSIETLGIDKAHLEFLGVDVDINFCRGKLNHEISDRLPANHQEAAVGFGQGMLE